MNFEKKTFHTINTRLHCYFYILPRNVALKLFSQLYIYLEKNSNEIYYYNASKVKFHNFWKKQYSQYNYRGIKILTLK